MLCFVFHKVNFFGSLEMFCSRFSNLTFSRVVGVLVVSFRRYIIYDRNHANIVHRIYYIIFMGPNLFCLSVICNHRTESAKWSMLFYKFDIRINVYMKEGRERNTFIDDMFIYSTSLGTVENKLHRAKQYIGQKHCCQANTLLLDLSSER